jgi:hypothetical protein
MGMKHPALLLPALLLVLSGPAAAATGPVVVELFTSQGCSSCPPADAILGELARRPDVLALALHVTYWNELGWRDGFSQDAFDARQRRYVQQLNLSSSYTPQMVVNGTRDVVGSQRVAVTRALGEATHPSLIGVRVDGATLRLSLPALERPCDCELTLFGVRASASTPVGRGENGGRTLAEFQVVRAMQPLGRWHGDAQTLDVPGARMPDDVTAVAVVAQQRVTGRVMAAGQSNNSMRMWSDSAPPGGTMNTPGF